MIVGNQISTLEYSLHILYSVTTGNRGVTITTLDYSLCTLISDNNKSKTIWWS